MNDPQAPEKPTLAAGGASWLDRLARGYPEVPLVAPYALFLVLMMLDQVMEGPYRTVSYVIRTFGCLLAVWMFRKHLPPWGRLHLHIAIPVGVLVAFGWVEIHHWFAGCTHDPCRSLGLFGISHHFEGFAWYKDYMLFDGKASDYFIPAEHFKTTTGLWSFLIVRIGGASVTVPIVEELFWRAFMLRILIDWHRFDEVPLAKFTLVSFLVTSALSGLQHPGQWEVGVLCWLVYNGLFYWKRSLALCMIAHGVTNFVLYVFVYNAGDWRFW